MYKYIETISELYNNYILKHKDVIIECGYSVTYYILFGNSIDVNMRKITLKKIVKDNYKYISNNYYCIYGSYIEKYMNNYILEENNIRKEIDIFNYNYKILSNNLIITFFIEKLIEKIGIKDIITSILSFLYPKDSVLMKKSLRTLFNK